jgi:hypothetical protein
MLNLGKNMKAIALMLLLAPVQGLSESQAEEKCSKVKSAQIVRVDDRSKRFFVRIRPDQISTKRKAGSVLLSLQEKITACYPHLGKEWSASFFSDERYADYKTEFIDKPSSISIADWSDHYIGEYERKKQRLTLYPMAPKLMKYFTIVLP